MKRLICFAGILILCLCGCEDTKVTTEIIPNPDTSQTVTIDQPAAPTPVESSDTNAKETEEPYESYAFDNVPDYIGYPYAVINDGVPFFNEDELYAASLGPYEFYSDLDELSRPQVAFGCLGKETMPAEGETRGEIGMIKPAGWHTVKYPDVISDLYLYNRCHLIGWQLGAENANEMNLMTGTRYLNVEGMLPFENQVADYIKSTGNHVFYRVTPYYVDDELIARGLLMEAQSIEDDGCIFCVYCYNVQPGIIIDYATGDSSQDYDASIPLHIDIPDENPNTMHTGDDNTDDPGEMDYTYVLNSNSMKIHLPDCSSVSDMSDINKEYTDKTLEELIAEGYEPCGRCHPDDVNANK